MWMHSKWRATALLLGADLFPAEGMELLKTLPQHGGVSVFDHSLAVACLCLYLAYRFRLRVDRRALVRGALLHDYFLYDWHVPDPSHRLHGFTHPRRALENARRDFALNDVEENMIASHMFPLTPTLPRYRESLLVCLADKICALEETLSPCAVGLHRLFHRRHAA